MNYVYFYILRCDTTGTEEATKIISRQKVQINGVVHEIFRSFSLLKSFDFGFYGENGMKTVCCEYGLQIWFILKWKFF